MATALLPRFFIMDIISVVLPSITNKSRIERSNTIKVYSSVTQLLLDPDMTL